MSSVMISHIKQSNILNRIFLGSSAMFLILLCMSFFPLSFKTDSSKAAPVPSATTLSMTTPNLTLNTRAGDFDNGTFFASDPSEFTVNTNNYTGYTLSISATLDNDNYNKLVNTNNEEYYLSSISSASTEQEFNANNWGYLPSKLNSIENTLYQPAPDLSGTILDITNTANIESENTYSIVLAAKVDGFTPQGEYINSFVLNAVANPANYIITYDQNTTDTVNDMPSTQSGDTTATSITIPNLTPKRAHYSFLGWCTATPTSNNGVDECSGNDSLGNPAVTYQPNDTIDINQTGANDITLHAMWKIDTFTLTVSKGSNISSVTGGGTYKYGEQVTVTATKTTDTTCVGYATPSWSRTVGSSALSTTSGNSIVVTITDNTTIAVASTSSNKAQTITLSRSGGASGITIAGTSYTGSSVSLNCGTYNISGSYSSGYTFSSWSRANGVTVANTGAASTTMTVSGPGTLTLTGKSSTIYIQNITSSNCPTSRTLTYDSRDGKAYYIQKIGSVCWMTTNMAYAASAIKVDSTYGGYYTWDNANSVCPTNWKLATGANYSTLMSTYNTGAKLVGAPWYGQYGGSRYTDGSMVNVGSAGVYWTSGEYDSSNGWSVYFKSSEAYSNTHGGKRYGYSVRCVAK